MNHLRSKGSCSSATGGNVDSGDGQGCWNVTRDQRGHGYPPVAGDRPDRQPGPRLPRRRRHERLPLRGPDHRLHDRQPGQPRRGVRRRVLVHLRWRVPDTSTTPWRARTSPPRWPPSTTGTTTPTSRSRSTTTSSSRARAGDLVLRRWPVPGRRPRPDRRGHRPQRRSDGRGGRALLGVRSASPRPSRPSRTTPTATR